MTAQMDGALRFGLDIGGTKTQIIAVDAEGQIRGSARQPTRQGAEAVVTSVVDGVRGLQHELGLSPEQVLSVGVGIPGIVNVETGLLLHAVNIGVESLDLAGISGNLLGVPVRVENDVKAAALGADALLGGGTSMGYLNLGTGVAAGIVIAGSLWRGNRGAAGEIGHIVVDPGGRQCGCGQHGCIESLCGGGALAKAWGQGGELPVRDLFVAAEQGDARAQKLRAELAFGAAAAVRVLILTTDVEKVVVGGGLTGLGEALERDIRAALRDDADGSPFLRSLRLDERVELLPPGSPAAALGAALVGAASPKKEDVVHG